MGVVNESDSFRHVDLRLLFGEDSFGEHEADEHDVDVDDRGDEDEPRLFCCCKFISILIPFCC